MTASDAYTDCFWCGKVYDLWREEACPGCGSRLDTQAIHLGSAAGEHNKRPDYNGPDVTDMLNERETNGLQDETIRRYFNH